MGKRAKGFEWISPHDSQQLDWALNRLLSQGRLKHGPKGEPPTYAKLLELGRILERNAEGQLLLGRMKSSWRTEKKRLNDRNAGLQSYTFILSMKAYDQLRALAEQQHQSVGTCLEGVISNRVAEIERLLGEQIELEAALKNALAQKERMHKYANEYGRLLEHYVRLHCRHELPSDAESSEEVIEARYEEIEKEIKDAVKRAVDSDHPAEADSGQPSDTQQPACEISQPPRGTSTIEAQYPQDPRDLNYYLRERNQMSTPTKN